MIMTTSITHDGAAQQAESTMQPLRSLSASHRQPFRRGKNGHNMVWISFQYPEQVVSLISVPIAGYEPRLSTVLQQSTDECSAEYPGETRGPHCIELCW